MYIEESTVPEQLCFDKDIPVVLFSYKNGKKIVETSLQTLRRKLLYYQKSPCVLLHFNIDSHGHESAPKVITNSVPMAKRLRLLMSETPYDKQPGTVTPVLISLCVSLQWCHHTLCKKYAATATATSLIFLLYHS